MSTQGPPVGGESTGGGRASLAREPLTVVEARAVAPIFKALADPVRLRLLSLIACHDGEAGVCDLTSAFDVTAPTISHHLKVLREAGLIDAERRGTWIHYRVDAAVLGRLATLLEPR